MFCKSYLQFAEVLKQKFKHPFPYQNRSFMNSITCVRMFVEIAANFILKISSSPVQSPLS